MRISLVLQAFSHKCSIGSIGHVKVLTSWWARWNVKGKGKLLQLILTTWWWHNTKSQVITKVIRIHPLGTMNFCTKFHEIHSKVVDISLDEWKTLTRWCYRKGQRITKIFRIHPLGPFNVCSKFHGNPSDSPPWYLTLNHKRQPYCGAIGKDSRIHTLGTWIPTHNILAIHPIVVEIFQFGPKLWTIDLLCHC